jgi:uncharacterized protein (TIGR03435 family)
VRPLVLLLCAAWPVCAQAPAFEAAAVKLNTNPNSGNAFTPSPGRLRVTAMTLEQLIQAAFHVKTGALFGATSWMQSDRFDIDATTPAASTFDQELTMLQSLLTERFQLRFHREARQLRVEVLVPAKGGPKFRPTADPSAKERVNIRPTEICGTAIPFGHFVSILEAQLKYPLTNDIGLTGKFDLCLKYGAPGDGASVFSALEEQLGLKIEARRGPVEVFVIDSAARP